MEPDPDPLVPYRLRIVRIGLVTTTFALVALAGFRLLSGSRDFDSPAFEILVALSAVVTLVVGLLPWERLHRTRAGMRGMYLWSALDILFISGAVWTTGGGRSELFLLYALTTAFYASYPERAQAALFLLTVAAYLTVVEATGWEVSGAAMFIRLVSLAILAFIASHGSRNLMREMAGHHDARVDSEHRAELLAIVAAAGRSLNILDPEQVLEEVVRSCVRLGFERSAVGLYEPSGAYRMVRSVGMPDGQRGQLIPSGLGMVGLTWRLQRTVKTEDYPSEPWALPAFVNAGVTVAFCTPIWSQGIVVASLVGGSDTRRALTPHDIEAFELLAADGGSALASARMFDEERKTVERLAQLDRMKSDFLSTVSHELRTPLTVIIGNGRTLADRWGELPEDLKLELVSRLNANAASLGRVIASLLDFSRLEAGHIALRPELMEVGRLLTDTLSRLSSLLTDHAVDVDIAPDLFVSADPSLLDRVVENLLANAARHTPPGTRVVVAAHREIDRIAVTIADDGPGISPADLVHLGERFYRGGDPNTRGSRGTGLGLALVREILALHGSALEIESSLGQGSRFSFRLPDPQVQSLHHDPTVPTGELADAS